MRVLFVQAGGTIDKDYLPNAGNHGYNFRIEAPAYMSILERLEHFGVKLDWRSDTALKKDSLDVTDDDRARLLATIQGREENLIIITHGTDTVRDTAAVLSRVRYKTIVLTGAMRPAKFSDSDAEFNLGMAVAAVHCLNPGVYIALYGKVVSWQDFLPLTPP